MPSIRTLIYHKYKIMINSNTVTAARLKFMAETLRELGIVVLKVYVYAALSVIQVYTRSCFIQFSFSFE